MREKTMLCGEKLDALEVQLKMSKSEISTITEKKNIL
jgi:hypothetical protein